MVRVAEAFFTFHRSNATSGSVVLHSWKNHGNLHELSTKVDMNFQAEATSWRRYMMYFLVPTTEHTIQKKKNIKKNTLHRHCQSLCKGQGLCTETCSSRTAKVCFFGIEMKHTFAYICCILLNSLTISFNSLRFSYVQLTKQRHWSILWPWGKDGSGASELFASPVATLVLSPLLITSPIGTHRKQWPNLVKMGLLGLPGSIHGGYGRSPNTPQRSQSRPSFATYIAAWSIENT